MSTQAARDEQWMREALLLAAKGAGMTRPNPPVGAVIVKNGTLVAGGYHKRAGGDHAEKDALKKAGREAARGATLYVTLEPCSTHGRTPPCTDWIIDHGLARVVWAVRDPNPEHAGRAARILRKAGIETAHGVCAREAGELLAPFRHWITTGRPWLTLKLAMTSDGKLADSRGNARWISGPQARTFVQQMRREADAVLVGVNTVLNDNPCLLPRPPKGRRPFRIILDSQARIPLQAQVLTDGRAEQTLVATLETADSRRLRKIAATGAGILALPPAPARHPPGKHGQSPPPPRPDLELLFDKLGKMGLLHLFAEGGGMVAGELLNRQLVNKLAFFYSPCFLGNGRMVTLGPEREGLMRDIMRFSWEDVRRVGQDVLLTAYPNPSG